jgi:hypothetical protein
MENIFDDYNPNEVSNKSLLVNTFEKFARLEYNKPLRFKIFPNPMYKDSRGERSRAIVIQQYWFDITRNGKTYRLPRPSLKLSGLDKDPQEEYVKKLRDQMNNMRKAGQDNTPKFAEIKKIFDILKPTTTAGILIVTPGSNRLTALQLPITASDNIFGKEAWSDRPAIAGVAASMRAVGRSPYDMKSSTGWIEILKIGSNQYDTEYQVYEAVEERIVVCDGIQTAAKVPISASVGEGLFTTTIKDVPDVIKLANQNAWTPEEVADYLTTVPGKWLQPPKRIVERQAQEQEALDAKQAQSSFTAQAPSQAAQQAFLHAVQQTFQQPVVQQVVRPLPPDPLFAASPTVAPQATVAPIAQQPAQVAPPVQAAAPTFGMSDLDDLFK